MKLVSIKRQTKIESRYSPKMGVLTTSVTYIKKQMLGVSIKTLYKYRETYHGKVKDCKDCNLFV